MGFGFAQVFDGEISNLRNMVNAGDFAIGCLDGLARRYL